MYIMFEDAAFSAEKGNLVDPASALNGHGDSSDSRSSMAGQPEAEEAYKREVSSACSLVSQAECATFSGIIL
jgi:hypothetical protein